ncbi:MAG: aminotransferase class V-fold PLP-dependent enzyme [Alphaproteobacteria bacterium]
MRLLPGPVPWFPGVAEALAGPSLHHRGGTFPAVLDEVLSGLREYVGAKNATLAMGSGTFANDMVAAQITRWPGPGLIATNGEFGDRLADHASRWHLDTHVVSSAWGQPLDWERIEAAAASGQYKWLWACAAETSTGLWNRPEWMIALGKRYGMKVAIDAISAIANGPLDLSEADLASATSGKGLGAPAGVAIVFHRDVPPPSDRLPRVLDLGYYALNEGVPFTLSSNLVCALAASVRWLKRRGAEHSSDLAALSGKVRDAMHRVGCARITPEDDAHPTVTTYRAPDGWDVPLWADAMRTAGIEMAYRSGYLQKRGWWQACLMGHHTDDAIVSSMKTVRSLALNPPQPAR